MTVTRRSPAYLSDEDLLAEVKRLAAVERRATAALIRSLMELDARRLYLGEGCSSLFTYCTQVLHLSESAAYNRIEAARAARRFASIVEALDDGSLTLTAVRLLAPHLTTENYQAVLAAARHKPRAEIERLVASLHPKAAAPSIIRKLPEPRNVVAEANALAQVTSDAQNPPTVTSAVVAPPQRSTVVPLAPERYRMQLTISRDTHDKLLRAQALLRHAIPNGDLAEILDRALTLLLHDAERRRYAATSSPGTSRGTRDRSRHIPAAIKREVWQRDEGRCAFVGRQGRCTERGFLEFHHVQPFAEGGAATAANVQLRCQAHHAYEAERFFGSAEDECVREVRWHYGTQQ